MKRRRYDAATKEAILETVKKTRSGGGTFAGAFEAAKLAGYKGSPAGLYQMVYNSKGAGKKRGRKKAAAKPVAETSTASSVVADIAALVNRAVKAGLEAAIHALEALK
ncbi:MAG TPA: hypothetical protein VKX17_26260 [Planctomycetota bacterium]|nr:hypothetical protein [Planctomycetota bacterium]